MLESTTPTYEDAKRLVLEHRKPSPSFVQRILRVGYEQARSWLDRMEAEGLVGPVSRAGVREIR